MTKLNAQMIGLAGAIVGLILYLICAFFFIIAPNFTLSFINLFFHGIDLTQIAYFNFTFRSFFLSLIFVPLIHYLILWLFATIYNSLITSKKE